MIAIIRRERAQQIIIAGSLLLSIAVALYFRLRFSTISISLDNQQLLIGSDSYYHLRNIQYIVANFPHLLNFDIYTQYPTGLTQPFIPIYDLLMASIVYVVGLGHPSYAQIYSVCAWSSLLFACLTIIITFYIARNLFENVFVSAIAAGLLAVMPGIFLITSTFGYNTDTSFEVLMYAIVAYLLVRSFNHLTYDKIMAEDNYHYKYAITCCAIAGILFGVLIYGGSNGTYLIPILFLYFVGKHVGEYINEENIRHQVICSSIFFVVGGIIVTVLDNVLRTFTADEIIVIYLIVCVGVIVAIGIFAEWFDYIIKYKRLDFGRKNMYYVVLALVVVGAAFIEFSHAGFSILILPITEPVSEIDLQSIFSPMANLFWLDFAFCGLIAILSLGPMFFKKLYGMPLFIFIWTVGTAIAAVMQSKFGAFLSINVAILAAYGLVGFHNYIKDRVKSMNYTSYRFTYGVFILSFVVFGIVFGQNIVMSNDASMLSDESVINPVVNSSWIDTSRWLVLGTPNSLINMNKNVSRLPTSAYGVLAAGEYGNYIQVIGKRIPVASPYKNSTIGMLFFADTNETNATSTIDADNMSIKYIITDIDTTTTRFHVATGRNLSEYTNSFVLPNATLNRSGKYGHAAQ